MLLRSANQRDNTSGTRSRSRSPGGRTPAAAGSRDQLLQQQQEQLLQQQTEQQLTKQRLLHHEQQLQQQQKQQEEKQEWLRQKEEQSWQYDSRYTPAQEYDYARSSLPYPCPSYQQYHPYYQGYPQNETPPLPTTEIPLPPPPEPEEVPEQDSNIASGLGFKEKLGLTAHLLDLDLIEDVKTSTHYTKRDETPVVRLPGSKCFEKYVKDFDTELRKDKSVSGLGVFPMMPAKMHNYKVADSCWNPRALQYNHDLLQSSIYTNDKPPGITFDQAKCAKLEGSVRDFVTVANLGQTFCKAGQESVRQVQEALRDPPTDQEGFSRLWNQLADAQELFDSVGRAHEDVASMAINISSNLVLLRRDAWLEKMKTVKPVDLQHLRRSDLQGEMLFEEEVLAEAGNKTEQAVAFKRQDKMLSGICDLQKKAQGGKQSFQFERKTQVANKGQGQGGRKPGYQGQNFIKDFQRGRGRGGAGRGGRGGRGGFNAGNRFDSRPADKDKKVE